MPVDPKTTAVVLIEYQNDFTSDGGVLHGAVEDVMDVDQHAGEHASSVVDAARDAGATIMHAPITFAEGYNEISSHPYGILKGVVDGNAFVKGTWGADIVDDLAPPSGDIVVEGKRGLDTFASTNLDFILRSKGITTIALGGFLTNCCVESTMRSGYENGLQGHHAHRLRGRDLAARSTTTRSIRLPDVLRADDVGRSSRVPSRAAIWRRTRAGVTEERLERAADDVTRLACRPCARGTTGTRLRCHRTRPGSGSVRYRDDTADRCRNRGRPEALSRSIPWGNSSFNH